jgi:hypothetical protein
MQKFSQGLPGLTCVDSVLFEQEKFFLQNSSQRYTISPGGRQLDPDMKWMIK